MIRTGAPRWNLRGVPRRAPASGAVQSCPMEAFREDEGSFTVDDLRAVWPLLAGDDRLDGLRMIRDRGEAEEFFLGLTHQDQADLVMKIPAAERKAWVRLLDPDDATDLVQSVSLETRAALLDLMDPGGCHRCQ